PPTPTRPQATICHGVHGPCPNTRLELSAPIAPTAKPGAPPRTKPLRNTMSVVGLTLGSGAKATRTAAARAASVALRARSLDDERGAPGREAVEPMAGRGLGRAVHAARGLVEADHRGGLRRGLLVEDDRQRQALALAAGEVARVAILEPVEADGGERRRRRLV